MRTTPALRGLAAAAILPVLLVACTPPDGGRSAESTASPVPTEEATTADAEDDGVTDGDGSTGAVGEATTDDTYSRGLPAGVAEAPESSPAGAAWSADGSELYVVTFGSSSCPLVAQSVQESAAGTLEVTLVETGGAVCTMDYTPTTTTVSDVGGVDSSVEHEVTIGDLGVVMLPAASDPVSVAWVPEGD